MNGGVGRRPAKLLPLRLSLQVHEQRLAADPPSRKKKKKKHVRSQGSFSSLFLQILNLLLKVPSISLGQEVHAGSVTWLDYTAPVGSYCFLTDTTSYHLFLLRASCSASDSGCFLASWFGQTNLTVYVCNGGSKLFSVSPLCFPCILKSSFRSFNPRRGPFMLYKYACASVRAHAATIMV